MESRVLFLFFLLPTTLFGNSRNLQELLLQLRVEDTAPGDDVTLKQEWETLIGRAVAQAESVSSELKLLRAKSELVATQIDIARSGYYPSLSAGAGLNQNYNNDTETEVKTSQLQREINLVLKQNLYRGGNDNRETDNAKLAHAISSTEIELARQRLDFQIREAILSFHDACLRRDIAQQILAETNQLESITTKKQEAGRVGRIDVEQTRLQQIETRTLLAEIETEIVEKKAVLQTLLSGDQADPALVESLTQQISKLAHPSLENISVSQSDHSSVALQTIRAKILQQQVAKAEGELDITQANRWLPTLDFVSSGSWQRSDTRSRADGFETTTTSRSEPALSLGLEANWLIWGAKQRHDIRHADRNVVVQKENIDNYRSQFVTLLTKLQVQLQQQKEKLGLHRSYMTTANDLYDAQVALYKAGNVEISQVLNANIQRLNALRNWEKQIYMYRLNSFRWRFVTITGESVQL